MSISKYNDLLNNIKRSKVNINQQNAGATPTVKNDTLSQYLNQLGGQLQPGIKPLQQQEQIEKGDGEDVWINGYKRNTEMPQQTDLTETKNDNSWKSIQQQIKMNTLNSKNEVANAQRHAMKNMDNYLKALGIQGTGLGQSAYVDLATQYSNQLAGINADEREAMTEARNEVNDRYTEQIMSLIEGTDNATEINKAIANMKAQGLDTSYLESYQKALGADSMTQAKELYAGMLADVNDPETTVNKEEYAEAIKMLESAIRSGDTKQLEEAYAYADNVINGMSGLNKTEEELKVYPTVVSNPANIRAGDKIYSSGTHDELYTVVSVNSDGTVTVRAKNDYVDRVMALTDLTEGLKKGGSYTLGKGN